MADWDEGKNPTATERADAAAYQSRIASLQAEVERLTRERDEWQATSVLFEASAKEAARGLECLSEIDAAWDAIGTRGNRGTLTLSEQISSLLRELDDAEASLAKLREGAEPVEPTHRHKKRGSKYVLIGYGRMQAENWWERNPNVGQATYGQCDQLIDMREVAIYRSVDDGSLWVRPREEFEDGRFEALPPRPTTEQTDARSGVREAVSATRKQLYDAILHEPPAVEHLRAERKIDRKGALGAISLAFQELERRVLSALSPAAPEGRFAKLSPDAPATIRENADTHLACLSTAELVADQPIAHTPDGRPVYDNTPTVVVVVVFLEGDHILVIRRAHNPGKGLLGLPGGYHMRGETWQEAGSREVLEETGHMVDPSDIQLVSMETDEYGNNLVVAFGPGRLSPGTVRDAEAEEVLMVSLEDVPSASEWAFPRHYKAVLEFVNG